MECKSDVQLASLCLHTFKHAFQDKEVLQIAKNLCVVWQQGEKT